MVTAAALCLTLPITAPGVRSGEVRLTAPMRIMAQAVLPSLPLSALARSRISRSISWSASPRARVIMSMDRVCMAAAAD
eukprot:scaffold347236_cov32-Prasinocladus_malaysianus.AAC.1